MCKLPQRHIIHLLSIISPPLAFVVKVKNMPPISYVILPLNYSYPQLWLRLPTYLVWRLLLGRADQKRAGLLS